ncbi:carbohydrate-binding domain-containing protein [Maribacter polysaccharolyticus]|uniref:carbohydrate-binding domain-containing protein n=1 Tax=Maribacter polysaccharolyticus TaxID=3020831 RepID=UPI00237F5D9F|nr:carbohydrate-binding domain-containing protein [Maribacter polysaccharolyticus]MDE3742021.1 carbohydrate-binding domain-containing protein [Maribacter polysaccharolyticus]
MKVRNLNIPSLLGMLLFATLTFQGCSDDEDTVYDTDSTYSESTEDTATDDDITIAEVGETHEEDSDYVWDASSVVYITLNGSSITVDGDGATVDGSEVTIGSAGNYEITGTLSDGQITVDTDDEETVRLILNSVDITNTSGSPINIASSEKTIVILSENTINELTDTNNYVYDEDEDEPNATLFSDDDLTIYGEGALIVNANYNDGIASKDGLVIASGNLTVNAVDDGIRGKDYLYVKDGYIVVNAEGDGLISDNDEDTNTGWVLIDGGAFVITADGDGIFAESVVEITYGDFTIVTGGGHTSSLGTDDSAKGIKSGGNILIEDGIFDIDSADDNLHASYDITITTGTFTLATGDDSIHADDAVEIDGGTFDITDAVEGIEAPDIIISDGEIYINSSDDAINAAGNTNNFLYINGGYIVITSSGDGLDANGDIEMTGGTVIVNGPTSQSNSPIDYDGTFYLNGGFLVASGYGSNMDEAGSNVSDQNSLLVKLSSTQSAGKLFHIENGSGEEILTFAPEKAYKSIVFSSSELSTGSYTIYLGGSSTGTVTDGVYEGGTYTPGTQYDTFSVSGTVTTVD